MAPPDTSKGKDKPKLYYTAIRGSIIIFLCFLTGVLGFSYVWIFVWAAFFCWDALRLDKARDLKETTEIQRKAACFENLSQLMAQFPNWVTFSETEKCAWLNDMLVQLWPSAKEATEDTIRKTVGPIFEQFRPAMLSKLGFSKVDFGHSPPLITGVNVIQNNNLIYLDLSIKQSGEGSIAVEAGKGPIGMSVKINRLEVVGTLRVVMGPLSSEKLPCFDAISISFLERPTIAYQLKVAGSGIPGLESLIDNIIQNQLSVLLLWPRKIIVPLFDPAAEPTTEMQVAKARYLEDITNQLSDCSGQGTLEVTVKRCRKLRNVETMGKSDPFVELYVTDTDKVKTETVNNNLDPEFKEGTFQLMVYDYNSQKLKFHVFDENVGGARSLGHGELGIARVCNVAGAKRFVSLPLEDGDDGVIEMTLIYRPFLAYAANPELKAEEWQSEDEDCISGFLFVTVLAAQHLHTKKELKVKLDLLHPKRQLELASKETWPLQTTTDEVVWNQTFNMAIKALEGLQLRATLIGMGADARVDIDLVKEVLGHGSDGIITAFKLEGGRGAQLKLRLQLKRLDNTLVNPTHHHASVSSAPSFLPPPPVPHAAAAAAAAVPATPTPAAAAAAAAAVSSPSAAPAPTPSAIGVGSVSAPTSPLARAASVPPTDGLSPAPASASPSPSPTTPPAAPAVPLSQRLQGMLNYVLESFDAPAVLLQSLIFFTLAFLVGYLFSFSFLGLLLFLIVGVISVSLAHKRNVLRHNIPALDETVFASKGSKDKLNILQRLPPWVQFPDVEKNEWINDILEALWPYVCPAALAMVKQNLDPVLLQNKPAFLSTLGLSLQMGSKPPIITGVRHYSERQQGEQIILDLFLRLAGDMKVTVEATRGPLVGRVVVKDIFTDCVVRVVLSPLVPVYPCFSNIHISLLELPRVDFSISFCGLPLMSMPGAVTAVRSAIKHFVGPVLVWPARLDVPILTEEATKGRRKLNATGEGILRMWVKGATDVLNVELLGKSDPYCSIVVHQEPSLKCKTEHIDNDLNPEWNEYFEFMISDLTAMLDFKVKDYEMTGKNQLLGSYSVNDGVSELIPDVPIDCKFPLSMKGKDKGTLNMELQWKPFVDAPPEVPIVEDEWSQAVLFVKVIRCDRLVGNGDCKVRLTVGSQSEESPIAHGSNPTFQYVTHLLVRNAQAQRLRVDIEEATETKVSVTGTLAGAKNLASSLVGKGAKSLGYIELQLDDVARQVTGFQDKWQLSGVREGTLEMAVVLRFVGPNTRPSMRFDDMKREKEEAAAAAETEPESPSKPRRMSMLHLSRGVSTGEARPGTLKVTVLEARNLPDVNGNGFSDPYASLVCERTKHKTKTLKKTINPQWNESFEFPVADANTAELTVSIKDHEQLGRNVLLGAVKFPVSFFGEQRVEEYILEKATGEQTRGSFKLQTEFVEKRAPGSQKSIGAADSVSTAAAAAGVAGAAGTGSNVSISAIPEEGSATHSTTSTSALATSTPLKDGSIGLSGPAGSSPAEDRGLLRAASTMSASGECPVPDTLLTHAYPPRSGTLKLHVVKANGLMAANTNGFSDPYVSIRVDNQSRKDHTKTIKRTLDPVWDEKFEFPVKNTNESHVVLQVKDWERLGKNQMLGGVTVPLACVGEDPTTCTFPLVGFRGTLTVMMHIANALPLSGSTGASSVFNSLPASTPVASGPAAANATPSPFVPAVPYGSSGLPGREESIGLPVGAAPLLAGSPLVKDLSASVSAQATPVAGRASIATATLPPTGTTPTSGLATTTSGSGSAPALSSLVGSSATPSAAATTTTTAVAPPPSAAVDAKAVSPPRAGATLSLGTADHDGFTTPTGSVVSQIAAEAAVASVAARAAAAADEQVLLATGGSRIIVTEEKGPGSGNGGSDDFVMVPPDATTTTTTTTTAAAAQTTPSPAVSVSYGTAVPVASATSHLEHLGGAVEDLHSSTISEAASLADEPIHDDRPALPGRLSLRIIRANNLRGANSDGSSDPYVSLTVERNKHKSKTIKKSLSPEWNEPAWATRLVNIHTAVLAILVKDHETFGRNQVIGSASVRVESVQHGTEIEVPLQPQGVLYLRIDVTPDTKQTVLV